MKIAPPCNSDNRLVAKELRGDMLNYEEYMQIKILFKQGKSIREISRLLKISRNTVRRALKQEGCPSYKMRPKLISKLAKYHSYLQTRLKTAIPNRVPGTVLLREIRELGYEGEISILREYLAKIRPEQREEPLIRFETPPGEQLQVDWIVFRRGSNTLSAFVATLGYSRASYVEFVDNERLTNLITCHEHAFEYFGGVPKEILYDNMKTIVVARNAYGAGLHRFQSGFLDFAGHHGFTPRLCRPYRAKTKGKVERFNGYLRYSFYEPLVSKLKLSGITIDVALGNYEVKRWLRDVANQRIHKTTNQRPTDLLREEQKHLQPLPPNYADALASIITRPRERTNPIILQHSLSLYDGLLREGSL